MNQTQINEIEKVENSILAYMKELQSKGELTPEITSHLSSYQLFTIQNIIKGGSTK